MGMAARNSDIDLSLEYNPRIKEPPRNGLTYGLPTDLETRNGKQALLKKMCGLLRNLQRDGVVTGVAPVYHAKVPIVKCRDVESGIECDISVCNRDGEFRSRFLQIISRIDSRFAKLCFLVKSWAHKAKINEAKNGTINSISLTLLVALHLQTRSPPILPPFCNFPLPHTGSGSELGVCREEMESCLSASAAQAELLIQKGEGRRNTSTMAELVVSFFLQLSAVENLWESGLCASTYHGRWIRRQWDDVKQIAPIAVEDFLDLNGNCARNVRSTEEDRIFSTIKDAAQQLSRAASEPSWAPSVLDRLFLLSNRQKRRFSDANSSSVLVKRPRPSEGLISSPHLPPPVPQGLVPILSTPLHTPSRSVSPAVYYPQPNNLQTAPGVRFIEPQSTALRIPPPGSSPHHSRYIQPVPNVRPPVFQTRPNHWIPPTMRVTAPPIQVYPIPPRDGLFGHIIHNPRFSAPPILNVRERGFQNQRFEGGPPLMKPHSENPILSLYPGGSQSSSSLSRQPFRH